MEAGLCLYRHSDRSLRGSCVYRNLQQPVRRTGIIAHCRSRTTYVSLYAPLPPSRPAAYWGLASSVFATLALCLFIYLYVAKEVRRQPPSGTALIVVGIVSSLGIGAGVGGFSVYLGLGIIHTLEGDGQWCVQCLSRSLHSTFLGSLLPSLFPFLLPCPGRPLFQTEYIVCVWSFMTWKWAVTSYVYIIRSLH